MGRHKKKTNFSDPEVARAAAELRWQRRRSTSVCASTQTDERVCVPERAISSSGRDGACSDGDNEQSDASHGAPVESPGTHKRRRKVADVQRVVARSVLPRTPSGTLLSPPVPAHGLEQLLASYQRHRPPGGKRVHAREAAAQQAAADNKELSRSLRAAEQEVEQLQRLKWELQRQEEALLAALANACAGRLQLQRRVGELTRSLQRARAEAAAAREEARNSALAGVVAARGGR